jgi:hypothetical protein
MIASGLESGPALRSGVESAVVYPLEPRAEASGPAFSASSPLATLALHIAKPMMALLAAFSPSLETY